MRFSRWSYRDSGRAWQNSASSFDIRIGVSGLQILNFALHVSPLQIDFRQELLRHASVDEVGGMKDQAVALIEF
jgi:hypothetical protein